VWNRTQFLKLAENEFPRAKRYRRPLSVILITVDLDSLDPQSQTNGLGAQILRFIADCCKENIRQIDILGRYEWNEFALLLPETDLAAAQMVARRLRKSVANRPLDIPSSLDSIQVQIQLSSARDDFLDAETMVAYAKRAVEVTSPIAKQELMK
ncbi:MAG TPA: GGDEF domain-containing protein, partial [Anaerolineaceae bacterium]|nr:GGDEF domain-containing protein [Anaerolineaceae bacterium]